MGSPVKRITKGFLSYYSEVSFAVQNRCYDNKVKYTQCTGFGTYLDFKKGICEYGSFIPFDTIVRYNL